MKKLPGTRPWTITPRLYRRGDFPYDKLEVIEASGEMVRPDHDNPWGFVGCTVLLALPYTCRCEGCLRLRQEHPEAEFPEKFELLGVTVQRTMTSQRPGKSPVVRLAGEVTSLVQSPGDHAVLRGDIIKFKPNNVIFVLHER